MIEVGCSACGPSTDEAYTFSGVSTPSCPEDLTVMKLAEGYNDALGMLNTWWVRIIPKGHFSVRYTVSILHSY